MGITVNGSELDFSAANVSASLGGGLVMIQPPAANANVPPSTLRISNGQFSGSFSGVVSAGSASGVGFGGWVSVSVDPAGGISASGANDTLTIAGQAITASFGFSEVSGNLDLHVSGVSFSLGTLLSVANAGGDLAVTPSGVTGSASGAITRGIAGLGGDLAVSFAPGILQISGTSDTLAFGDQSIAGSFSFTRGLQAACIWPPAISRHHSAAD